MADLQTAYDRLQQLWEPDQLAGRYRDATRAAARLAECSDDHLVRRPIALLAIAVPACATLSVAIHVIHVLPRPGDAVLLNELLGTAEKNAVLALHRSHQALDLDGRARGYAADDWLPAIYDVAASLLEGARLDIEPPSLVVVAQDAVQWLSRAIIDVDEDTPDSAAAIVDALGRMLALHIFTEVARTVTDRLEPTE
jgi:hypothetical protein